MAKGSCPHRKEMMKEGSWKIKKEEKSTVKNKFLWLNTIGFSYVEFSKLCLTVMQKIITLMRLLMFLEEIFKMIKL